jgi:hypothetical protein
MNCGKTHLGPEPAELKDTGVKFPKSTSIIHIDEVSWVMGDSRSNRVMTQGIQFGQYKEILPRIKSYLETDS